MRTITVAGHGVSHAVPDVAIVDLAATHVARSLPEALAGAESARAQVVATAKRFTDQVGSQGLSVGAEWNDAGRQDRYRARHSLRIRCSDLDRAGELVSALAGELGERLVVDHVGLEVGEPGEAVRLAREAAFADARATAEHLAALAGAALGSVESVVAEDGGSSVGYFVHAPAKMDVSFEAGRSSVTQTVTVTFELL